MALYVGTNYHPHDWSEERWKIDIKLMKEAGFTTVRLGHLCWDSYEPEDGVYTFEWFDKVMDLFAAAGIGVLLDVSVRPAPVWVHKLCPGCDIVGKSGKQLAPIRRYMEDVDDPAYQKYALRFANILVNRYKNHPALFAFGLCNEQGSGFASHSEYTRIRFVNWLRKKYGTVEKLNEAWTTRRWSRRLPSFEDVWIPEDELGYGAPEACLDFKRFLSDGIGHFLQSLKKLIEKNALGKAHSSNHFADNRELGFDYMKEYSNFVDYPGVGYYPGFETKYVFHLKNAGNLRRISETGKPLWCLEFQTGKEGIFCGAPGYTRMLALLQLIYRTQMFLGWTWRSMLGGEEQFYFGMLRHDGTPSPNYTEFAQIASIMKKLQEFSFPYLPVPEVAVAYSYESEWASCHNKHFRQPYKSISAIIQQYFYEKNRDYNIVDLRNLKGNYKVIFVPNHCVMDEASSQTIRSFVEQGGTVIMNGYSANMESSGRVFDTPLPGTLSDVFGIHVTGFYRTDMPCFYTEESAFYEKEGKKYEELSVCTKVNLYIGSGTFQVDLDYYELIECKGAEILAEYTKEKIPAITVNSYGKGKAYYVAAETNLKLLNWIMDYVTEKEKLKKGMKVPEGIQARRIAENQYYYVNTTNKAVKIELEICGTGILKNSYYEKEFQLEPWSAELIVS